MCFFHDISEKRYVESHSVLALYLPHICQYESWLLQFLSFYKRDFVQRVSHCEYGTLAQLGWLFYNYNTVVIYLAE